MIFGIGIDCVEIKRMERLLGASDEKALHRLFTPTEIKKAEKASLKEVQIATFAKRYAAKEAFAKALGTGIGALEFKDIEVANTDSGAPIIHLSEKGQKLLAEKTQNPHARVHLSLSDERETAIAFVVIEV